MLRQPVDGRRDGVAVSAVEDRFDICALRGIEREIPSALPKDRLGAVAKCLRDPLFL